MLNLTSNYQTVFQCSNNIAFFHIPCIWIPVAVLLCQHLALSIFLILGTLMYALNFHFSFMKSFTCISLMSNEFECFIMCLLVIFLSFVKCLHILLIFKLGSLSVCYWVLGALYIFWIQVLCNVNFLPQSVAY